MTVTEARPTEAAAVANAGAAAEFVTGTVIKGIEAAQDVLGMCGKLTERALSRNVITNSLDELENYRSDYSTETSLQIAKVKKHILNGIDVYFLASQHIYEWASFTALQLSIYIKLFNDYDARKAETQKYLLTELLNHEAEQMNATQLKLNSSSFSFQSAAKKLTVIRNEFAEKKVYLETRIAKPTYRSRLQSLYNTVLQKKTDQDDLATVNAILNIFGNLTKTIKEETQNIDYAKDVLKLEIQHISDVKKRIKETFRFVNLDEMANLRDEVIKSAQNLIEKAQAYRAKHTNQY